MSKYVNKFVNRVWGFLFGVWMMMILDPETYRHTLVHYYVFGFCTYFIIFGDSHFSEKDIS